MSNLSIVTIRKAMTSQRALAAGVSQMAAQNVPIMGEIMLTGIGEVAYDISFPVRYKNKPVIQCNGELVSDLQDGAFPTLNCLPCLWIQEEEPPFKRYYKGVKLAMVVTGDPGQKIIANWSANGIAYMNPLV